MTGKWISEYLTEEDIQKISEAVGQAEQHTTGEIVPVIAKKSESKLSLGLRVLESVTIFYGIQELLYWKVPGFNLSQAHMFLVALGFAVLVFLCLLNPVTYRWFVRPGSRHRWVWKRAVQELKNLGVQNTEKQTGIIIYVSVFERKAVIVADQGIATHIQPQVWNEIVQELSNSLKNRQWGPGFQTAITRVGKILAEHFPAQQHNRNELANQLRILE